MSKVTPMLRQYYDLKSQYPGCILLFRLGDFYEMFDDDAVKAAKLLDITLTSREAGQGRRIPMCGVPHHAADKYIASLVEQGEKIALCEQIEDPKEAKGVVKRDVVRVITPGTVLDSNILEAKENNFLAAVYGRGRQHPGFGFAFCDPSTGEFRCTEIDGEDAWTMVQEEILRINPAELLVDGAFKTLVEESAPSLDHEFLHNLVNDRSHIAVEEMPDSVFHYHTAMNRLQDHFKVGSLDGFGMAEMPRAVSAASAIIAYLGDTHKTALHQVTKVAIYSAREHMLLDHSTRRNLELARTIRSGERRGSLLWLLDRTRTAMGSRLLSRWIMQPLIHADMINRRLDATERCVEQTDLRYAIQEHLDQVSDIERLLGRVAYGSANGRDLKALQHSLQAVPPIKAALAQLAAPGTLIHELMEQMDPCTDLADEIDRALVDDPPVSITEGGLIKKGYDAEVDVLKETTEDGKEWVTSLESTERSRTGIKSLKVGFNKVFGYYIEVTKANLSLIPEEYERRQTLANAERFITPALKEREAMILSAEERVVDIEHQLFIKLREKTASETPRLQQLAAALGEIDVYASMAEVAVERRYVKPNVNEDGVIHITSGRHPIVEAITPGGEFVPNDVLLDDETQVILLTGPNMAGKSTFLRQTALIVLMAQIGSFVPADTAHIGIVDRIFTRVGASDDLATGQSTFMVEMNEVANILHHATEKSLIILDEVGRGTSTFDGLSIAWSVTEFLHNFNGDKPDAGPKTLFATHYHELTQLAETLPRLKTFSVAVHKRGSDIVFLRRIIPGAADQSYGIEVARLAGLPPQVIERAQHILNDLESNGISESSKEISVQIPLFATTAQQLAAGDDGSENERHDPVLDRLNATDINQMTPLDALNFLGELIDDLKKREVGPA